MQLTAIEVRILGSLIEKEATTPDNYPLSLNALTNACNQTSNRDPIMEVTEDAVRWAINNLRQQSLVRAQQGIGSRVMKYHHLLTERLSLDAASLAVLCALMLRGPQTTGEIKGRTHRLTEFANLSDVETTLSELVTQGFVVELSRQPGQKEVRYTHLLSGPPDTPSASPVQMDTGDDRIAALEATVAEVRQELADLRARFEAFERQF
jgi:uncharacterized protein YceH (UPF0502 family)